MRTRSPRPDAASAAGAFARLAQAVELRQPDEAVRARIEAARQACDAAAAQAAAGERRDLLINVQAALRTWQEVWPRLGAQALFCAAVAREARAWAKRFA